MARLVQSDLARSLVVCVPLALVVVLWRGGLLDGPAAALVADTADRGLNEVDENRQTRDYYERAMDVDRGQWGRGGIVRIVARAMRKGEAGRARGNWIRLQDTGAVRDIDDGFLNYELLPGADVIHMDVPVKVNRWGQRDHDYERAKPPGTFRIALVGGSNTMGYGVPLEDTFAKLLEERLDERFAGRRHERFEVINFSVGGYQLLDRIWVVQKKMLPFEPDMIMVAVTMHDLRWAVHQRLAARIASGGDVPFEFARRIMEQAGVEPGDSEIVVSRRLKAFSDDLVRGAFAELQAFSDLHDIPVVALMLRLRVNEMHETMHQQTQLARDAGLLTVEIFDAFEGRSGDEMYLRPTDQHPSSLAHGLIGAELFEMMIRDPQISEMLTGQPPPDSNESTTP